MACQILTPLFRVAVKAAADLPPDEKADLYDAIAHVATGVDPELAKRAQDLALAIRESEALQLHFRNLFR